MKNAQLSLTELLTRMAEHEQMSNRGALVSECQRLNVLVDGKIASTMKTINTLKGALLDYDKKEIEKLSKNTLPAPAAPQDAPVVEIVVVVPQAEIIAEPAPVFVEKNTRKSAKKPAPAAPQDAPVVGDVDLTNVIDMQSAILELQARDTLSASDSAKLAEMLAHEATLPDEIVSPAAPQAEAEDMSDAHELAGDYVVREIPWQHYLPLEHTYMIRVINPGLERCGFETYEDNILIDAHDSLGACNRAISKKAGWASFPSDFKYIENNRRRYIYRLIDNVWQAVDTKGERVDAHTEKHLSCVDYGQSLRHCLRLAGVLSQYENDTATSKLYTQLMKHREGFDALKVVAKRAASSPKTQPYSYNLGSEVVTIEARTKAQADRLLLERLSVKSQPVAVAQQAPAVQTEPENANTQEPAMDEVTSMVETDTSTTEIVTEPAPQAAAATKRVRKSAKK